MVGCGCHRCVQDSALWVQWSRLVLCQVRVHTQLISKHGTVCWPWSGHNFFSENTHPSTPSLHEYRPTATILLTWQVPFVPGWILSICTPWAASECSEGRQWGTLLPKHIAFAWVWQLEAQKNNMSPPKAIVHIAGMASNYWGRTAKKIGR